MRYRFTRGCGLGSVRKEAGSPSDDGRRGEGDEGYVLALVTIGIFAILVLVGLVVDVGSWYSKASKQQRAADAGALAGAQTFAATGSWDAARAEAARVTSQNGFTAGGDFSVVISQVGTNGVQVVVEENDVQLFFAQLATSNVDISRGAVATPAGCGAECDQDVTLGRPFTGITALGDGDGFRPVLVGTERVYAINHHVGQMNLRSVLCIERATNTNCPGYPKTPNSFTGIISDMVYHAPNNALYYFHQTTTEAGLGCWSTATDNSCGVTSIGAYPPGPTGHLRARGSNPVILDNKAYIQTDDYKMHCFNLSGGVSPCAGFPKDTGFTAKAVAGNMPADMYATNGNATHAIDVEVIGDRIFHSISDTTPTGGTHISCWDTATEAPCADWLANTGGAQDSPVAQNGQTSAGLRNNMHAMMFIRYSSGMTPNGICVHDYTRHSCFTLAGGPSGQISGFNSATEKTGWAGGQFSLEASLGTKTFFPGSFRNSHSVCWDWSSNSHCGTKVWGNEVDPIGGKATQDYGYASDGNCIFALGHTALFWSFDENFGRCFGGGTAVEVNPCICSTGEPVYGSLQIPPEVLAELDEASAEVTSLFGTTLIPETDLLTTGGLLDMSGISTSEASVILIIKVQSDSYELGGDVWEDAISAEANVVTRPVLVD